MKHFNVEIKARCGNHEEVRQFLVSHNADFKGIDRQVDTYFNVRSGRLKLREGTIENFLIYYERDNQNAPKESDVTLFPLDPTSSLKSILIAALDVLVIVDKQREIYFIDNVKFHIDTVKDLGTFVEIEAIDNHGTISKEKLLEQCTAYRTLFNISDAELVAVSYSDLLLKAKNTGQ